MSRFRITLRDENLPDDVTVLLHLGGSDARAMRAKVANMVKQHDRWIGVLDSRGRFALSAYAALAINERTILERMPHRAYGRSTVGRVRQGGFQMLPTSIAPVFRDALELQSYHYSIVLAPPGYSQRLLDDTREAVADAARVIEPAVRQLLSLFDPTLENPFQTIDET